MSEINPEAVKNPFSKTEVDKAKLASQSLVHHNLPAETSAAKPLTTKKESHPIQVFVNKVIKVASDKKALAARQTMLEDARKASAQPTSIVEAQTKQQNQFNQVQQNKIPLIRAEQQLNTIRSIIRDEFGGGKRVERIMPAIYKVLSN